MNFTHQFLRLYLLQVKSLFFIAVFLCVQSIDTSAQVKSKNESKIHYEDDRYHFKKGWVNSGGVHLFPLAHLVLLINAGSSGIGQTLPVQYDYTGYLLVKPKLGLGASISYTKYQTGELGYEYFTHYKFVDFTAYGKMYINDGRRRWYVDSKIGYGLAANGEIRFSCVGCEEVGPLYIRYTSGLKTQHGIGIDFASPSKIKSGIKLSISSNYVTEQRDRHVNGWETTPDGIIKRSTYTDPLKMLFFGIILYI